jgi:pimeloyl-ACP methyl ester carboxylesterase/2-polyprenyl-6-methoxyphenol hydroxylase-like FAD-dependent oxidoreductase
VDNSEEHTGQESEGETQEIGGHRVVRLAQGGVPIASGDRGPGEEAVVIGGSMAGLFAARVLADRFDRVMVVDRDRFPDGPQFRKGVPQSRHVHVLLAKGLEIAERLFPGIEAEWVAAGAVPIDWPRDVLLLTSRGWCDRFTTGIRILCASREFLEWGVRRRLATFGNVRFLEGHDVTGLMAGADGRRVEGLRIRARSSGGGGEAATEELRAGLVVDASGRNSRAPEWLAELGYSPPAELTITPFLGYASCRYAIPADFDADWRVLFLQGQAPAIARGGALFPIEGNRWIVTLAGTSPNYPPTEDEGFLAFARSLRSPVLHEAIRRAERLTPIHAYRQTESRRRFYEKLPRLPERFLVIGDAVCAFNPIYGQGMTIAAQSALVLDRLLSERANGELGDLPTRFERELARVNAAAWLIATGEDLRWPGTEGGERNLQTRLTHRYLDRVIGAANRDQTVNLAFHRVLQLVAPPPTLLRPGILLRVLLHGAAQGTGPPPTATRRSGRADEASGGSRSRAGETPIGGARLRIGDVRVSGVRSPVLEAGPPGADEAVVFVHGNPGSSQDWVDLAQAVGAFGRAVALDMPGFGRADKPPDFDYTVAGYARHLAGALDRLGVRRAHLVLHDFGGPWGLAWAIAHPEAFGSATFINVGVLLDYRWHYLARIWRTPILGELCMATTTRLGMRLLVRHGNPRGLPRALVDRMYDDFDRGTRRAVLKLYRATGDQAVTAWRMAEALRQIPRPALVVWGKHDPYVPVALAERQREVFPDAQVVILEGSGHWPFADDPGGVARVVVPFLRQVLVS